MMEYVLRILTDDNDKPDDTCVHEREVISLFVCYNITNNTWITCIDYDQIRYFFKKTLNYGDVLIGHNIIVDCLLPLQRLLGIRLNLLPDAELISVIETNCLPVVDTMVFSQILFPRLKEHGLKDWKDRLNVPYKHHCSTYSSCVSNARFTSRLYKHLLSEADDRESWVKNADGSYWNSRPSAPHSMMGYANLFAASYLMIIQEAGGIHVDAEDVRNVYNNLKERTTKLAKLVASAIAVVDVAVKVPKTRTRNGGTELSSKMLAFIQTHSLPLYTPEQAIALDEFITVPAPLDLSSTKHLTEVKNVLINEHGWTPSSYTKTGVPQFYIESEGKKEICPSLQKISEKLLWVEAMLEYSILTHKMSMLVGKGGDKGWLENKQFKATGRLPAGSSGRAVSLRHKHRVVVNLPKVGTPCGREIRGLIKPSNHDMVLVGYDVKSLEDRIKAHYAKRYDKGAYAAIVTAPDYDVHTTTQKALGLADRSDAKRIVYGLQYGMGVRKLAATLKLPISKATEYYNAYWKLHSGWKTYVECVNANRRSDRLFCYTTGVEIENTTDHETSSRIIQHTGAYVLDLAAVLLNSRLRGVCTDMWDGNQFLPYYKLYSQDSCGDTVQGIARRLLYMHDEYLWEVDRCVAKEFVRKAEESVLEAGRGLGLEVDLHVTVNVGDNYAECH